MTSPTHALSAPATTRDLKVSFFVIGFYFAVRFYDHVDREAGHPAGIGGASRGQAGHPRRTRTAYKDQRAGLMLS